MAKLLWSLALLASTVCGRPSGLRALFARDAPSVAVSEYFVEPAPDFTHDARAFRVDALPETDELVKPFVGSTFRYPFVKVQLDGGETTKNYDRSVTTADDALQMLEANDLSYVLRFEEIDESRWPSKLVDLVPAELRGDLTKELMGGGTTVHAYVSAAGSKALPTHADVGDILVVQLSGTKRWTLGGDMVLDMAPGDALWLPAGLEHSARARDETSVHLTIHRVSEDQLRARRLSDDDDNRFADPDRCPPTSSSDRGCYDCGCGECNLCSDSGAFCTTSADQMTKNDPCCLYESGGDYDDDYCLNDKSETVDAWMWRTNGESGEQGKDCDWIGEDPDARCQMKGVFVDTVFGTIDTRGWLIREYGLDYLYENQKVYKAKKACPCACGTKDCNPCVDDQLWKAGRTIDNCKWVSKDPGDRCDVVSTYDGTKAKDFCRATCGTCGDGPAPGYKPTKKPSGPAPQCEDFGADVVDTATGEAFCERSGLDDEASCTACGTCCEWDGSRCNYWIERETSSGPNKDCPRTGGAQYVPTYKPTRKPSGECEDDETWEYFAGDKGYKRCDHVAKKPDPRCGRVSDDGVVASEACPKTCGTCR